MARYIVKETFDAGRQSFEKGQEVDVSAIPAGCLGKFSLIGFEPNVAAGSGNDADAHNATDDQSLVVNPDRDELKKLATELGLTFPANISTAKLTEMVNAKAAEINQE